MNVIARSIYSVRQYFLSGVIMISLLLLFVPISAIASEVTWTGAIDSMWSNPDNWENGVPGFDEIVIIPFTTPAPEVDSVATVLSGLILEEGATVRILDSGDPSSPNALYIIGEGDLDGDGFSDIFERDYSFAFGNFDVDGDGIPNFADPDSDNDGLSDACEYLFSPDPDTGLLHPYIADDPNGDIDSDGWTNAEECAAGSDPTDFNDQPPPPLPIAGFYGLGALFFLMAAFAVLAIRRAGPRSRRVFLLLLVAVLLPLGLYMGVRSVMASTTLGVDFALGQTVEQVADTATSGDTLEINGASVRPWNGQSTYVTKAVTLKAVGGTVFLGGMRTTMVAGVLGQGSLDIESAYTGNDHSALVSETLFAGTREFAVFLGERLNFKPLADAEWFFSGWGDDAAGSDDPLEFQAFAADLQVTAIFGPPGPDLAASIDTGPPAHAKAGNAFNVVINIQNIGQDDTAHEPWYDRLYLSRDSQFDDQDLELATAQERSSEVDAGDSYTATFSVTMPDVAPGQYFVLGVADKEMKVELDIYRDNNVTAAEMIVLDVNLAP